MVSKNDKKIIIGLYSPAPQSGKSAVAKLLVANYGFECFSFATPIKSMLNTAFAERGLDYDAYKALQNIKEAKIPKFYNKSYRELMQSLGDWGRSQDVNMWVDMLFNGRRESNRMVIDDVRFPNEFYKIKKEGGILLRINRPNAKKPNNHSSEGGLDALAFDGIINNNNDMTWLAEQVHLFMKKLDVSFDFQMD